jgi:hypothetical protein
MRDTDAFSVEVNIGTSNGQIISAQMSILMTVFAGTSLI